MEFVRKVKENSKYKNIPLIFVTSLSEKEEMEKGLELGVYDYIIKPVEKNMVYLKIRNAINFYENSIELEKLNQGLNQHEETNDKSFLMETSAVRIINEEDIEEYYRNKK